MYYHKMNRIYINTVCNVNVKSFYAWREATKTTKPPNGKVGRMCIWLFSKILTCFLWHRSRCCSQAHWGWTWTRLTSTLTKRCGKLWNILTSTSLSPTSRRSWKRSVRREERTSGRLRGCGYQTKCLCSAALFHALYAVVSSVWARGSWCVWLELSWGRPGSSS